MLKPAGIERASATRLTRSPEEACLYAAGEGTPLVGAREALGWNQSELARRSETSSAMVSQLEGVIGRRVSRAKAETIANALGREVDELFTTVAPPARLLGNRWRAATPATERYDGSKAKDEAALWQAYLERTRDSAEPTHEWPNTLSLVRAAERFGLNAHTLAAAADAKRVSGQRVRGRGPGGVEWEFDERKLAEELESLPACAYEGCDMPAVGPSGGCEAHGHAILQRGARLSEEVRSRQVLGHLLALADPERGAQWRGRIAAAKRGTPRPRSVKEKMWRGYCEWRRRQTGTTSTYGKFAKHLLPDGKKVGAPFTKINAAKAERILRLEAERKADGRRRHSERAIARIVGASKTAVHNVIVNRRGVIDHFSLHDLV